MHLQRFRQSTVRDALAAVRRELGPDALVVSTELVRARGWRRLTGRREVQVTAAAATPLSESRPAAPSRRHAAPPDDAGDVVARLAAAGVDRALAIEVAAAIPHRARRGLSLHALREALAGRLQPIATGVEPRAAVEVFVGPPGAGKTTTIAKIAAQARARGGVRLGLVAADGYRVGAVEQLRIYADILSVPFAVARTPQDLEPALASFAGPVLVDTAGRSPSDGTVRELFAALAGRPGVRTHLVLPAATSARDAERVFGRYEAARPDRVVLTRVDETESAGPLLRVLRERRLPVSYLGTGQRVPEDLATATPALLAGAVLGDGTMPFEEIA